MDKMTNWYDKVGSEKTKLDKNFKKHYILPRSMICCIGGTGAGKTNALVEFMDRKNEAFFRVMIFTGSTGDEPLYKMLEAKGAELYTDIDELPSVQDFEDEDKTHERLVVFDDFINLPAKKMIKIQEYLTSGRKYGFTCWLMAQNYVSVPKTIIRNVNYFILFRLNDTITLRNILKNHNIGDVSDEVVKGLYMRATAQPRDFFMIDLKGESNTRFRHNFLDFYK
jgi:hypothetical protein